MGKYQMQLGAMKASERIAMEMAAAAVMKANVADWQGKPVAFSTITDSLGTSNNVEKAARSVARELLKRRMTVHEAVTAPKNLVPHAVKNALEHFYFLMHDDLDLTSMGMGKGQMLLMQMNAVLEQYYHEHAPARLVS